MNGNGFSQFNQPVQDRFNAAMSRFGGYSGAQYGNPASQGVHQAQYGNNVQQIPASAQQFLGQLGTHILDTAPGIQSHPRFAELAPIFGWSQQQPQSQPANPYAGTDYPQLYNRLFGGQ